MTATATAPPVVTTPDPDAVQRRTLRLLFGTQVIGGIGTTIGISVGALLAERLGGVGVSGLGQSCVVVGAALLAVPVSRLMAARGRRPGLLLAYLLGAIGAVLVVLAARYLVLPLFFVGMLLFGGGSAANLQARYTAVDLSPPRRRGRQLSIIVWATTLGAVVAPNLVSAADDLVRGWGLPELTGPFVLSALAFGVVSLLLSLLLRPDPLLVAQELAGVRHEVPARTPAGCHDSPVTHDAPPAAPAAGPEGLDPPARLPAEDAPATGAGRGRMREAVALIREVPAARLGVAAVAVGHLVMVSVMSMTPVHMRTMVHGDLLTIVGIVLSVHIVGMYALAPVVGWLADRVGRRPVILGGIGLLLAACAVAGTSGHGTVRLTVGLGLLGLGWSGTMVGGSTLLTDVTPVAVRPAVQGFADLCTGLAGALGGALSGVVVELSGYPTLTLLAAVAAVPLLGLALRRPVPAT